MVVTIVTTMAIIAVSIIAAMTVIAVPIIAAMTVVVTMVAIVGVSVDIGHMLLFGGVTTRVARPILKVRAQSRQALTSAMISRR